MFSPLPVFGHFQIPGIGAAGNTVLTRGIPPFSGPPGEPAAIYSYKASTGGNWLQFGGGGGAVTCITRLEYLTGLTAHTIGVMQPLNFTTVNGAVAKGSNTIVLTADPGVYSTNYKYKSAIGYPTNVADNPIAASDYFAVQLTDGSWFFDKVSSMSTLTVTTTTALPSPTTNAGGIADQAPFFFFGVISDTIPATGQIHPQWLTEVAATGQVPQVYQDNMTGYLTGLRPGDPMLFISNNLTNRGDLALISGVYTEF